MQVCYICRLPMLTTTMQCGSVWVQCVHCIDRICHPMSNPLVQINIILHTAMNKSNKEVK